MSDENGVDERYEALPCGRFLLAQDYKSLTLRLD